MQIRKWGLLGVLLFLLAVQGSLAAPENLMRVRLNGTLLDPDVQAINHAGNFYINLPMLSKYLNVIVAWNIEDHDLFLKMGRLNIKLYAHDASYFMNGVHKQLKIVPYEAGGQFWLPVKFLTELGLVVQDQDAQQVGFGWKKHYLLGVESTKYQGRTAFLLRGTQPLEVHDQVLQGPTRLVLTLPGVVNHFSMDNFVNPAASPIVKKIRFRTNEPGGIKVIFDLNQTANYQLMPFPDKPNQILVVFNYRIERIKVAGKEEERKITIVTSDPGDFQIQTPSDHHQTVITFAGATLKNGLQSVDGDGAWCRDIRLTSPSPRQVRMEVNFINPDSCYGYQSPFHPNEMILRPVENIKAINGNETDGETRLNISADNELFPVVTPHLQSGQLDLELRYAQIPANIAAPEFHNRLIRGIHFLKSETTSVKLSLDMAPFVNYRIEYSEDHHRMTLIFKHSPLVDKTIIIDPGHGGEDNGAYGRQTREKDVNLEIAMHLKERLEQAGAAVVLTRTDDYFVGLYERPFLANDFLGDLFISVHTNNHPDLTVHGIEVFSFPNRPLSQALARSVLNEITKYTGFVGLGAKSDDLVVIREAEMPSILVEVGFLSNFQEENVIQTPEFKEKAAEGIYQGILDYWESEK